MKESEMFGYNVYGVYADSYEDACMIAGIDTPEQLRQEAREELLLGSPYADEPERPLRQPVYCGWCRNLELDDEIPF